MIPEAWLAVPESQRIRSVQFVSGMPIAGAAPRERRRADGPVRTQTGNGEKLVAEVGELTPAFVSVDSLDLSTERKEVVFSAKRADNFDIGLVSVDGSAVNWVPHDPADEVAVQWAPRGHKVSYTVRRNDGDLVRTVHIPTSFQYTVDFAGAIVHDLAWDEAAERFAVAVESVDASDRVEVVRYTGEDRRTVVPPSIRLDVTTERVATTNVMRPSALRYGERLPLVVWIADAGPLSWDDARGALQKEVRLACAVTDRFPDAAFLAEAQKTPWIDGSRVYVVNAPGVEMGPLPAGTTAIVPDATVAAGRYRRQRDIVAVRPAGLKSFAAGYIANQLKGIPPPNGSH